MDVANARRPEDVFGELVGDRRRRMSQARVIYRRLAFELHPDQGGDGKAFARLADLWEAARHSIADGTYGTERAALVDPVLIRTRRNAYQLVRMIAQGDIANIYQATYDGADALIKISRRTTDNDLIANEAKTLKHLLGQKEAYDQLSLYLPGYIESFGYRPKDERKPRQASAFTASDVPLFTLAQIREQYPDGVHPKDMAWMFRRVLMALGWAHRFDRIHGAVLPEHLLFAPMQHGLVVCGWTAAVEYGQRIKVVSGPRRGWYPPEVASKSPAIPGTDIFMAINCMAYVLGADPTRGRTLSGDRMPEPIAKFFAGCQQAAARRRPQDAWALLDEFTELVERMWGPRRYRPFYMREAAA